MKKLAILALLALPALWVWAQGDDPLRIYNVPQGTNTGISTTEKLICSNQPLLVARSVTYYGSGVCIVIETNLTSFTIVTNSVTNAVDTGWYTTNTDKSCVSEFPLTSGQSYDSNLGNGLFRGPVWAVTSNSGVGTLYISEGIRRMAR